MTEQDVKHVNVRRVNPHAQPRQEAPDSQHTGFSQPRRRQSLLLPGLPGMLLGGLILAGGLLLGVVLLTLALAGAGLRLLLFPFFGLPRSRGGRGGMIRWKL